MGKFRPSFRLPLCEYCKKLVEVKLLTSVGYVDDFIRVPGIEAILDGSQISSGIIEPSVALTDKRRSILELRNILKKNCQRTFAFTCDAFPL